LCTGVQVGNEKKRKIGGEIWIAPFREHLEPSREQLIPFRQMCWHCY
jgi:hypothetical protein